MRELGSGKPLLNFLKSQSKSSPELINLILRYILYSLNCAFTEDLVYCLPSIRLAPAFTLGLTCKYAFTCHGAHTLMMEFIMSSHVIED